MNVVVTGPNAKGKGWITGERVRDAGGDWPNVVVIGPKIQDGGGTAAGGWLSSRGAGRSTVVVGVVGARGGVVPGRWAAVDAAVGACGEGGVMPVDDAAAASAFLFLLRSRLFLLLPFFSSPSFGASAFPISSCCCLTGSASGASRGKVLALIIFDRVQWLWMRKRRRPGGGR